MNLYMIERHEFAPEEIQLLSTFASQAAVSIENARLFEATRQLAITDPLTGLANHRQFYDQLEREFRRAQRYERPLTLLMLDLDRFKAFNDRYGHLAGDHALRETADVLRQNARSVDILARYGGEEFAIILPETDLPRAASHAERIRSAVASNVFQTRRPAWNTRSRSVSGWPRSRRRRKRSRTWFTTPTRRSTGPSPPAATGLRWRRARKTGPRPSELAVLRVVPSLATWTHDRRAGGTARRGC